MIAPIPASAWQDHGGAHVAEIALPAVPRAAIWAEGWDAATAAMARAEGVAFTPLPRSAVAVAPVTAGRLRLAAPRPPARALAIGLLARGSVTLGAGWPRALLPRPPRDAVPAVPDAAQAAALLARGEGAMLLTMLGEALLAGAGRDAILDAAREALLHRARHPASPDPGLALLVAALSG